MIIKWLGLDTLTAEAETLRNQIKHLTDEVNALEERVQEKIDEIEEPDLSDYVREDEVNDRIETYCNDNDIPNKDWIEGEIGDKVQEAIDNAGIEEQVRDLFNDASPSPMSEEDIKKEVAEQVKEAFDDLSEGDKLIDRIIEEYENVQAVRIERAVQKAIKAKAKPKKK